jgi:hypothetical protein
MQNKTKTKLPKNMTIEEASDFWDAHDIFEFGDFKEVDVKFQLHKKRYVGINEEIFAKIEAYAKKKKIKPETLIQEWVLEKTNNLEES